MKHLLILVFAVFMIIGCNDKAATATTDTKPADSVATAEAPAETLNYAYTLDKPYRDWQPGDKRHAVMVMKSLKAYEDGDIAACMVCPVCMHN